MWWKTREKEEYSLQRAMMWLLSSWTNFLVTASSIICFTCTQKSRSDSVLRVIVFNLNLRDGSCIQSHSQANLHRFYIKATVTGTEHTHNVFLWNVNYPITRYLSIDRSIERERERETEYSLIQISISYHGDRAR